MNPEPLSQPVQLRVLGQKEFLAVTGVQADVLVDGPLASSTLRITFRNDLGRPLEGDLVFPLPPSCALRALSVRVGSRTIDGKIKARQRAQADYERAVSAGQTAVLGESEGEDLARLRIAPIEDNQDVEVTLTLLHALSPISDGHRLLVPLTYMPRYVEDEKALKPVEQAALDRPRPLTLAARATVNITVLHSGKTVPTVRVTSHSASIEASTDRTSIKLQGLALDRDVHLEIMDRPEGEKPKLWLHHDSSKGPDSLGPSTVLAIMPPAFADEGPTIPRVVTFLVDRSGSMGGGPMQSAIRAVRGALRALEPQDYFNIIAFDTELEALARHPIPFSEDSLKTADAFIQSIDARGGTEASRALTAALDVSGSQNLLSEVAIQQSPRMDGDHRLRLVVFMTDGDVAGAEHVLKTAGSKLVDTRLHVLGIGHSVNHGMLAELATLGGGTYSPVATNEDLEKAIHGLKNAMQGPLWTSIRLRLRTPSKVIVPEQIEPAGALDLYADRPLLVAWRGELEPCSLLLDGQRRGGEDLKMVLRLDPSAENPSAESIAPATVWALLRNRRLTYRFDPTDDPMLEDLGSCFGIVNRAVALVGVDPEQRNVSVQGSVAVSLPMPGNVAAMGGFGPAVRTRSGVIAPGAAMPVAFAPMGAPPPPAMPRPATGMMPSPAAPPPPQARATAKMEDIDMAAPARSAPGLLSRAISGVKSVFGGGSGAPSWPQPDEEEAEPTPAAPMAESTLDLMPSASYADLAEQEESTRMPNLEDSEAGLRSLLLEQGASGLFANSYEVTLAAVAALVLKGHTHREGLFRSELRRTLLLLKAHLATLRGNDRLCAAMAFAILQQATGGKLPEELPADLAELLRQASPGDKPALASAIRQLLNRAPLDWDRSLLAKQIRHVFGI